MELKQVSDSCYAVLNEKNRVCDANSGLINRGGGVVIDTQSDLSHARKMIEMFGTVWAKNTPMGWTGSYSKWFDCLDLIAQLEPEAVVPGHGPICGLDGVKEMKTYLQYVRDESKKCFDEGLDSLNAAKKIEFGPYSEWIAPARLYMNVERAYREFRGEPAPPRARLTPSIKWRKPKGSRSNTNAPQTHEEDRLLQSGLVGCLFRVAVQGRAAPFAVGRRGQWIDAFMKADPLLAWYCLLRLILIKDLDA